MSPTKAEIEQITTADPRYYYRTIRRLYPDFFATLCASEIPFSESLHCWLHNDGVRPLCNCGKTCAFLGLRLGYRQYCSTKCAANSKSVQEKRVETNLERFGVRNSHQSEHVKAKFYSTMHERYGVKHALQNTDLSLLSVAKFKMNDVKVIREKAEQTNLSRYGTKHPSQTDEFKEKRRQTHLRRHAIDTKLRDPLVIANVRLNKQKKYMDNLASRVLLADPLFDNFSGVNLNGQPILYPWQCRTCNQVFNGHLDDGRDPRCPTCFPFSVSRGQSEVQDFLDRECHVTYHVNDRQLIRPWELDIVIPDLRLALEYHGLYYHHDGKVDRFYHLDKMLRCQEIGYRLIQIFENEWLFKRPIVENRLKSITGNNRVIFARQTKIQELSHQQAAVFLNETHLQGTCPAATRLGLFHDEILVAAMTFGKARFTKKYDYELLRFASAPGITVIGGAGKLFADFRKIHPTASLISYSDRRWNTGGVYTKIGFKYSHSSPPNYFYSQDKVHLLTRNRFQKHRLQNLLKDYDPTLTEAENMYNHKFVRIWDCGNDVFTYVPT